MTTTPARPRLLDMCEEALRPFFGPTVSVVPSGTIPGRRRAQETPRRYEAARQSLLVQQIIAGVAEQGDVRRNVGIAQTALAIRGWDSTRWAVAAPTLWTPGSVVDFHCGTLGVAEAVRVTFTAYDLVAGLGPDELTVSVAVLS